MLLVFAVNIHNVAANCLASACLSLKTEVRFRKQLIFLATLHNNPFNERFARLRIRHMTGQNERGLHR